MLILALTIFTLIALMGLGMALDVFKGMGSSKSSGINHTLLALVGSALAVGVALTGDNGVWAHIRLAVLIIGLGLFISIRRCKGLPVKGVVARHGGLGCFVIAG